VAAGGGSCGLEEAAAGDDEGKRRGDELIVGRRGLSATSRLLVAGVTPSTLENK
jgi:hypothetical protein